MKSRSEKYRDGECVLIQGYLAGLAVFVQPANWARHAMFVHSFSLLPIGMLGMALVGRMRWAVWHSTVLYGLMFLLYATANSRALIPWASAMHPMLAMVLVCMAVATGKRAWGPFGAPSGRGHRVWVWAST